VADQKAIEFAIKGNDLASKPLAEIGEAVTKLTAALAEIVPASEKGEKNLTELKETAAQLKEALKGLSADQAVIDQFKLMSEGIAASGAKLEELKAGAVAAKAAFEGTGLSAAKLKSAQAGVDTAILKTETSLQKQNVRLNALKVSASAAGVDLNNLTHSQALLDSTLAVAAPAYARVNAAVAGYAANQRKAALAATEAAAAAKAAAAVIEAAAAAEVAATRAIAAAKAKLAAEDAQFMKEHAAATAHATAKQAELRHEFSLFPHEGRTTLSFFQRIRGELLSMTAEFVGFYGVIEQFKKGFEDIEKLEGSKSLLETTFGGAQAAAEQLKFLESEAARLKLTYTELVANYARFTAAAKGNGVSLADARQVFSTFAEVARIRNLSGEQTTAIFNGLEKIFAKDTLAAGELFRKLTMELPEVAGAFRKFLSEGLSSPLTTKAFDDLLKSGRITAAEFIAFTRQYREQLQEGLPAATRTTTAALVEFQNKWDELRRQVLEGGVLDQIGEALRRLTAYFQSPDGKAFVSEMAEGFSLIGKAVLLVVEHLGVFREALEILIGLWGLHVALVFVRDLNKIRLGLLSLASGIVEYVVPAILLMTAELNGATIAATGVKNAVKLIGLTATLAGATFYAAFQFGTWLNNEFPKVRQFGVLYVNFWTETAHVIHDILTFSILDVFNPTKIAALLQGYKDRWADEKDQLGHAGKPNAADPEVAAAAAVAKEIADMKAAQAKREADDKAHQEANAVKDAADKAKLIADSFDAATKSVRDKINSMVTGLRKKTADASEEFRLSLQESLKPLRDEIAQIQKDNPQPEVSGKKIAALNAQLAVYARLAQAQFDNEQMAKNAERTYQDINVLLKAQRDDIEEVNKRVKDGTQTDLAGKIQIRAITNAGNAEARTQVDLLRASIEKMPVQVRDKLNNLVDQLKELQHHLTDDKTDTTVEAAKENAKSLTEEFAKRAALLDHIQLTLKAGNITTAEAAKLAADVNTQYASLIPTALAYVNYLQTSTTLTQAERDNLKEVAAALEDVSLKAKVVKDQFLTQAHVTDMMATGLVGVGKAFAQSVGQGHKLGDAFRSAGQAFKKFASDFLMQIGEMILKQTLLNALGQGGPGGGVSGGVANWVSSLFGAGASSAASAAIPMAASSGTADAIIAGLLHAGGMAGSGTPRLAMDGWFRNAPRYHQGAVAGLQPDEIPAILQHGEEVLAKNDARNAMNGGKQSNPQHIQVINGIDHESIVRQGLAAPSNTKVILNMMRANKGAIRTALA
jgi:hypothetical protein